MSPGYLPVRLARTLIPDDQEISMRPSHPYPVAMLRDLAQHPCGVPKSYYGDNVGREPVIE